MIKRYDLDYSEKSDTSGKMVECEDGEFVFAEDAIEKIKQIEGELEKLFIKNGDLISEINNLNSKINMLEKYGE